MSTDDMSIGDMFVTSAPIEVYNALGERWPTRQQWDAISAPLEPSVLVAGAGSGKTAVMPRRRIAAARRVLAESGRLNSALPPNTRRRSRVTRK